MDQNQVNEEMNQVSKYRGVFHSLDAVLAPLKSEQYSTLPEVNELLHIYKDSLKKFKIQNSSVQRKYFIVLEGLDGCGKSTITKLLAQKLNGKPMNTPPPSISHLRETFDQHSPELRRAFYGLGNYLAAEEARFITQESPVIMDRFWTSTTAYAIGNEVKEGNPLPPPDSSLYDWPSDLLQPDFIVYLAVTENVRLQRLSRRTSFTKEELELKENETFRENLEETYRRMKTNIRFINGNFPPKKVVSHIQTNVLKM